MSPQKMAKKDKAAEMATSVDEQNQRNANQLIIGLQENYIAVKNELIRIDPNQILKENEQILHKCANLLIENERIGREEFEALFDAEN